MRYAAAAMVEDYPGFHDFERAGWEDSDVSHHYEKTFAALTRQSNEALLDAGRVVAGSRLLDVACGPGFLTSAATARGAHAIGVDFSEAQVAGAAKRHAGLRFERADAGALPFPNASFDVVLSNFGMLHFPDAAQAAAEACRILVSGGRFAFTVWDQPERVVAMGAVLRAVRTHGTMDIPIPAGPEFFALSEPLRSQELLRVAGFENSTVEHVPQVWHVAAPDEVFETFRRATVRMGALLREQSAEQSSQIRAALRDSLNVYRGADGYDLPMPALLVTGHKPRSE